MNKRNVTVIGKGKSRIILAGTVSNQEAAPVVVESHKDYPEITMESDTFKITVKDDEEKVIYSNESEPFKFPKVPSLVSALRLYGAKLSDDQISFVNEALKGSEETGKAVAEILETINDALRVSEKNRRYQAVFTQYKPVTEERIDSAQASIVRNFIVKNKGQISDETAIKTLQEFGVIDADYTVDMFRSNKGKR